MGTRDMFKFWKKMEGAFTGVGAFIIANTVCKVCRLSAKCCCLISISVISHRDNFFRWKRGVVYNFKLMRILCTCLRYMKHTCHHFYKIIAGLGCFLESRRLRLHCTCNNVLNLKTFHRLWHHAEKTGRKNTFDHKEFQNNMHSCVLKGTYFPQVLNLLSVKICPEMFMGNFSQLMLIKNL